MKITRNISSLVPAVVAGTALLGASLANAAVLNPGSGIYVFSGGVTITHNPSGTNYNCTLDTKNVVDIDPAGTGIEIMFVNAAVTACGGPVITPIMPWYTTAPMIPPIPPFPGFVPDTSFAPWGGPPAMPVPVQINNFDMTTPAGACGAGNIGVTYDNNPAGTPSSFMFPGVTFGACTINGMISSVPAASGFIGAAADIDIFW